MLDVKDKEHFKKLVSTYETTLQSFFPKIAFVERLLRLQGWLECEGGMEAVEAALRRAASSLRSFKEFSQEYTFRTEAGRDLEGKYVAAALGGACGAPL